MKKKIILTAIFLVSCFLLKAQETSKLKAQPDSIIKIITMDIQEYGAEADGYSTLYTIGGKLVNKEDVVYRLLNYAPSAVEYNAYKKNATSGYILYGSSFVALSVSTFEFVSRSKIATGTPTFVNGQPAFAYSPQNKTGAYILAGVAIGALVAAIITFSHARKHGKKSVWLYNIRFE